MSSKERFPVELHKLALVLVFLVIAALSNWMALAYIHDFIGRTPLPDVIFDLIDEQPWATPVGDFMVTMSCVSLIVLFAFHKHRNVILRRTLFIIGCLYTLRTLSMLITQLPSGYKYNNQRCRPALPKSALNFSIYLLRTLEQTVHVGFQDNTKQMLCGDLLFSGHTLIMVIASLTVDRYIDKSFAHLKWLPFSFAIIGIPCMVISRTHYTCDVVIAYLASKAVFTLYHAFCEIESSHERRGSILRSLVIIKIVSWLEENVNNYKLKNEFEIPFMCMMQMTCMDVDEQNKRDGNKFMGSNSSSTAAMESV